MSFESIIERAQQLVDRSAEEIRIELSAASVVSRSALILISMEINPED